MPKPTEAQIQAWRGTGHPYKLIAAEMAEWAAGKERGTVLPDNDQFGRDLDVTVSPNTYLKAKRFLVTQGVLEVNDGPHYVALSRTSARPFPRRPGGVPRVADGQGTPRLPALESEELLE